MAEHTQAALAERRRKVEALAFVVQNAAATSLMLEMMDEIEHLTQMLTIHTFVESLNRYHRFDGIKDDMCPSCGGRVAVEESPSRVRLRAVNYQRAS